MLTDSLMKTTTTENHGERLANSCQFDKCWQAPQDWQSPSLSTSMSGLTISCTADEYNYQDFGKYVRIDNRRSSEIQGTVLGKCLRAWSCIYRSMPAGVAQSRNAFVGGTVNTWGRWRIPVNKRQKRHQKCRSNIHCLRRTCRSDSRFPQLVV